MATTKLQELHSQLQAQQTQQELAVTNAVKKLEKERDEFANLLKQSKQQTDSLTKQAEKDKLSAVQLAVKEATYSLEKQRDELNTKRVIFITIKLVKRRTKPILQ